MLDNKTAFNILFKKIKHLNKKLDNGVSFDMASLTNIKHNMKVSSDTNYLITYLDRSTNNEALRQIVVLSYKQHLSILEKLNNKLNENVTSTELNKLINEYNENSYLLEKPCENLAKGEDLPAKVAYFKDLLVKKDEINPEEEVNKVKDYAHDLASHIYVAKEYKSKFMNSKFMIYVRKVFNSKFRKLKPTIASDKIRFIDLFKKENFNRLVLKTYFFGNDEHKGFITTFIIYFLLILFGFVYVYPILYMLGYSFMSISDLVNPNVNYVPSQLEYQNYLDASETLNYWKSLGQTLLVSILPAICQTISCSLIAWGLARYHFKGKKILFGLVIFTFLVPSCLTMLPTVSLYAKFHITGNVLAYVLPALFGQGIKSAVFILIFYQYFKALPKAIIEAAQIDGANDFVVFIKIALPAARSGILLTILLSIVWYYNETVLASLFFGSNIQTLPLGLENFKASFDAIMGGQESTGKSINEAIYMAGTMLNILPLLLLYFFTQKYFIQGVDKAGITGE